MGPLAGEQEKKGERRPDVERLARVSLLSAVALVLSYLETLIPLPVALPGVKLGLANVAVAVALFSLDARSAASVAAVKVLASGLLFGSPMMLAYSLGGTALAFAGMAALSAVPGVGLVPVSMVAAILHNAGQLGVAALVLQTPSVFINLPVLAVAACVTGGITGTVGEAALLSLTADCAPGETGGAETGAAATTAGAAAGEAAAAHGGAGPSGRPAVDCAPLGAIAPGELVAFVGANGSGKTSCALQVAGLAGAAGDEAAPGRGSAARVSAGRRVGVSFQDPDSQIVAPVVRDDVAFGPENLGIPREEMLEIVNQALVEAGIEELSGREVDTLSGGQKQRVAVAGLLALAPGLVVFDEATAMLDPAARASFGRLVRRLCDSGVAVIQATQVMEEALATDRVAVFDAGRIVRVSEPSEVLADEALLAGCGLRAPESVRLARAMAALGVNARDGADGGVASRTATLDDLEEAICRWYAEV